MVRFALAFLVLALAASAAGAADVVSERQCGHGVCMASIRTPLGIAPCEKADLTIEWAMAGGAMSIQCWTEDAPMDQPIVVFDRRDPHGPVYDMVGIRAYDPKVLPDLAHPPTDEHDASLAACAPPRPATMAPGELLLTDKVPSPEAGESHPYCLEILRVVTTPTGIAIATRDPDVPKPRHDLAGWSTLAAKVSALIARADAQSRAHVTSARAPLRDAADAKVAPHGYLVQGDAVVVLDGTDKQFVKVLYVGAGGKGIERWIARADIAQ